MALLRGYRGDLGGHGLGVRPPLPWVPARIGVRHDLESGRSVVATRHGTRNDGDAAGERYP